MKARSKHAVPATPRRRKAPPVNQAALAERRARLRRVGRIGSVLTLIVFVFCGAGYGVYTLIAPQTFPLQAVRFDSELDRVREQDLRAALDPHLHGGFWGLDLDRIRLALEELEWVETASVRRVWPGALHVNIREQQAVAAWNDQALLNKHGELFTPRRTSWPEGLPALSGPERRAVVVNRRLQELRPAFAAIGVDVRALSMDARESWVVTLEGGTTITLGREDVDARIRRFTSAYRELSPDSNERLASVDLRYPNGFAIRWSDPASDTK